LTLEQFGWDSFFARPFSAFTREGSEAGRVVSLHHRLARVRCAGGELTVPARRAAGEAVVGDWVVLTPGCGAVEAVLPRRTLLQRKQAGRAAAPQAMAANVDVLLVVTGLDGDFNVRRMERYLVLAAECDVEPVLVLSKADLLGPVRRDEARRQARSIAPGTPVVLWSAFEAPCVDALTECVGIRRTAALVGSSGAGKSTLVNRLLGSEVLATQPVRADDSRGRHTTTHRELLLLPQGWLIVDMPGLREVGLWASEESVNQVFNEVAIVAASCRFRDCTHTTEPGCAVREAVENGQLESDRLEHRRLLRGEASSLERKRRMKILRKASRRMQKDEKRR
jgi:ribosome biogenesis GTPase